MRNGEEKGGIESGAYISSKNNRIDNSGIIRLGDEEEKPLGVGG